jgi:hypothetical protein
LLQIKSAVSATRRDGVAQPVSVWINRDGLAMSALRLFYPYEPTFIVRFGMSQMCPEAEVRQPAKGVALTKFAPRSAMGHLAT